MDITSAQREAIKNNCLATSWQTLIAWRLKHQVGSVLDDADLVVDWLVAANHRSPALVEEMIRCMSERLWRIQTNQVVSTHDAEKGVYKLDIICGGLRWTLCFRFKPALQLLRVSR